MGLTVPQWTGESRYHSIAFGPALPMRPDRVAIMAKLAQFRVQLQPVSGVKNLWSGKGTISSSVSSLPTHESSTLRVERGQLARYERAAKR